MSDHDVEVHGADAVVVGAGPNGLAAAVTLAQSGLSVTVLEAAETIGGGARTRELIQPGLLHDVCSAVHPFGVGSPFFNQLPLTDHGLEWRWPEIDLAHPLDRGRAGVVYRSIDATVDGLGADGDVWRRTFGPLAERFDRIAADVLGPLLRFPDHPLALARFGLRAVLPATAVAGRFRSDEARGVWSGVAAHVFRPLGRPFTAAAGSLFAAALHARGWPVAAGGSAAITDALASLLRELGGRIETGVEVSSFAPLDQVRVVLFDTSPSALLSIVGDRLPARSRRDFRRFRHGPGAFKVDLAVDGGVPWTNDLCRRAGTVHLGGTIEEVADAELDIHRGRMPTRPFVLAAQQYLCDPQRSDGDIHPVWAYAHVPHGYTGDATDAVLGQFERFAPGTRDRIVAKKVMSPTDLSAYDANLVGGDVAGGANSLPQIVFRPRVALDPYATGLEGVYLCSASTPPGGGVHGMCGHLAARSALRDLGHRWEVSG